MRSSTVVAALTLESRMSVFDVSSTSLCAGLDMEWSGVDEHDEESCHTMCVSKKTTNPSPIYLPYFSPWWWWMPCRGSCGRLDSFTPCYTTRATLCTTVPYRTGTMRLYMCQQEEVFFVGGGTDTWIIVSLCRIVSCRVVHDTYGTIDILLWQRLFLFLLCAGRCRIVIASASQ